MNLDRRRFGRVTLALLSGLSSSRARAQPPGREVPWLAEVQTRPRELPADAPRLPSLLVDASGRRITNVAEWLRRRGEIRQLWLDLLRPWTPPKEAPNFEILATDRTPKVVRQLIRYETEPGVEAEAYLLKPSSGQGRRPGVVVLHSTTDATIRQGAGLSERGEAAWGLKLAERGCVAICPRCFLWDGGPTPDYAERAETHLRRHRGSLGMTKMWLDAQRAVDVLASMPEVDPRRIGAAGHSLGAKEVLYLAAFDERIQAAVSSEGGIGTRFSNWEAPWYLGSAKFPREHHELLALVAPRAFLLIGGQSADGDRSWPFIENALEVYRVFGRVPRIGLFNHRQGHTIPPLAEQRVYEWLLTYL